MATAQVIPMNVGVETAGGGYLPKFKATGGVILQKQPEAYTPFVTSPYFTTTGILRNKNKKKFIYEQPQFENHRRKPWDAFPGTKASWSGTHQTIDWSNPFANKYRETVNATENRMMVDRQEKQEEIPKQWLSPADVKFDLETDIMFDYKTAVKTEAMVAQIAKLKEQGYTDAEISHALEKQREKEIDIALEKPVIANTNHLREQSLANMYATAVARTVNPGVHKIGKHLNGLTRTLTGIATNAQGIATTSSGISPSINRVEQQLREMSAKFTPLLSRPPVGGSEPAMSTPEGYTHVHSHFRRGRGQGGGIAGRYSARHVVFSELEDALADQANSGLQPVFATPRGGRGGRGRGRGATATPGTQRNMSDFFRAFHGESP